MDDDGFIYIAGRSKDMLITGGLNVYPAEVERVIAQHPAVLEAAVIGIPDDKWGEIGHALVVLHPGGQLNEPELLDYLGPELAKYKIPKRFTIRQEPLPPDDVGQGAEVRCSRAGQGLVHEFGVQRITYRDDMAITILLMSIGICFCYYCQ